MGVTRFEKIKRVLIYRLGSLGDTVVALPSFHLIARAFPAAERRVLTNIPIASAANPISAIIGNSGLVHGYMAYPIRLRNPVKLFKLSLQIRRWQPEVMVYLAEGRGKSNAARDALFFKLSGVKHLVGVPNTKELQENRWISEEQGFEYEGARLARCLSVLGETDLADRRNWDLRLTPEEGRAKQVLEGWDGKDRFIACSVGTKIAVNEWGEKNWAELLRTFSSQNRGYGLMMMGGKGDADLSERLGQRWRGPKLNLCGRLSPREGAAVLQQAAMFIGHDSGPIHLAASVDRPSVGIYSARNKPGVWFPYGDKHRIIYHEAECSGCKLTVCEDRKKKCITSITVAEVIAAMEQILERKNTAGK
jgi:heptosyltransferase III